MVSDQCNPSRRRAWVFPFGQDKASFGKAVLEWAAGCAAMWLSSRQGQGSCSRALQGETVSPLEQEDHSYCFVETQGCPGLCWVAPQPVSPHASLQAMRIMVLLGKRKSSLCLEQNQHFPITFLKPRWTWCKCATSMPSTVTFEKCFYTWGDS